MSTFPVSATDIKNLANELALTLHRSIRNTHHRLDWSKRNFELLRKFSKKHGADSFPNRETGERQFLWDFVGYVPGHGILIAAESEFDKRHSEIEHDFEKLLYVCSPIKLMMCRVESESAAEEIRLRLNDFVKSTCKKYSPAEVFVVYCVWWGKTEKDNRDFAYTLQIDGKPMHCEISNEKFERIPLDVL